MKICFATSECVPFAKTGGLADVAGALPKALAQEGCEIKVFLPLYGSIDVLRYHLVVVKELQNLSVKIGNKSVAFNVSHGKLPDSKVDVYFIDCPEYYQRPKLYTDDPDEDERFILFQLAIFQVLQHYKWSPDVMHSNDWQTSLLPVYLKMLYSDNSLFKNTAGILSIHNIGYQGRFKKESVLKAGLPEDQYYPGGPFEFDNTFSFLKAGIVFADLITTVSETYAREIQTAAYGEGMESTLASRSGELYGILNGIDTNVWNPQKDNLIPFRYSLENPADKKKNKKALLKEANLPFNDNVPTIGIVSRLAKQKGFDLLQPMVNEIMRLPLQIVALGSGEQELETFFNRTASTYAEKFAVYLGFNNELAHQITAGCDMFLMPSRYEPCGLNQMYSLNYGTVPIVRKTGGLADTVHDYHENDGKGNGFSFNDYTAYALYLTILRALDTYRKKKNWTDIMKRGMKQDFSWRASAKKYVELYKKAIDLQQKNH